MSVNPLTSFQEIQPEWERLLLVAPTNSLFLTPQWQEVWWENFGDGSDMAGFYLRDGDDVTAIASLRRSGDALSFVGSEDTFDYNDFMVRPGCEPAFFDALLWRLEDQHCRVLHLASLLENSPTLEFLPDAARQRGYQVKVDIEDVTAGIELPQTWEQYLATLSKKDRHELRRKFRRLDTSLNWSWRTFTAQDEILDNLPEFISLMRLSRAEKDRFLTPQRLDFFRRIAQRMSHAGAVKLFFLDVDGHRVAASLCFDYAQSRLLYNSGHNPEFAYYSVGLLLNALCLKQAIEEGVGYFDFLRGRESYKLRLGGRRRNLYRMVVKRI